ncbi:MAG: pitrilysin family protein [Bacteroidales bacterium]|nr:pitrilysin family protein [Bacteroidales bacterium]
MEKMYHTHTLPNGIRLIHRQNNSDVAHFGLLVHTGTRDENSEEHGLAHFMEHMFFKGTRKRSAYQIIFRLEDVGGEINAYTTKEETAIYASFLKEDLKKAVELIQDIFLNSLFSEKERAKETEVILSEIQTYEDTPSELIFDHAEELLFPDHPIGRNILGSKESLNRFRNGLVETFRNENYATCELVLCSIGNIPFASVVKIAEKYFLDLPGTTRTRPRVAPQATHKQKQVVDRNTFQAHCIIAGKAYSYKHADRVALHLLNNILGGPGMNSRLNMALRERRGFSYSAESHYLAYTDSGAVNIYFSCDKDRFSKSLEVTKEELKKLRKNLIPEKRLVYARRQLLGQIAISSENSEHLMLSMAKSHLLFNRVDSLPDIARKLEAVSADKLRDIANEVLDPANLNTLIYK